MEEVVEQPIVARVVGKQAEAKSHPMSVGAVLNFKDQQFKRRDSREGKLMEVFGMAALYAEPMIFNFMKRLDPTYNGGYWEFVDLSNGGFFMYPSRSEAKIRCSWPDNYSDAEVSPEAAGMVATLFALSHLSFKVSGATQERICELYEQLREYAYQHPECPAILSLTD